MSAELAAHRTAAAAVLGDFRRESDNALCNARHGELDWIDSALRLAVELESLLRELERPDPAADQLAQIRLVLDSFDWETDDRQYALEQIEQIVSGASR